MTEKNNPSTNHPQTPSPSKPTVGIKIPTNESVETPQHPTRGSTTVSPEDPGGYPPGTGKPRKWQRYSII